MTHHESGAAAESVIGQARQSVREHTPTPWRVSRTRFHGQPDDKNYITIHDDYLSICKMTGSEGMQISEVPDAEFIVRAVNSYDDMLAALKIAREYVARVDGTMSFTRPEDRLTRPDLDKIDAAISKAEGRA